MGNRCRCQTRWPSPSISVPSVSLVHPVFLLLPHCTLCSEVNTLKIFFSNSMALYLSPTYPPVTGDGPLDSPPSPHFTGAMCIPCSPLAGPHLPSHPAYSSQLPFFLNMKHIKPQASIANFLLYPPHQSHDTTHSLVLPPPIVNSRVVGLCLRWLAKCSGGESSGSSVQPDPTLLSSRFLTMRLWHVWLELI